MDKISDFIEITVSPEELEEQRQQQSEDLVYEKEADEKVRLLKEMTKYLTDDKDLDDKDLDDKDPDEEMDMLLFELKSLHVTNPITKKIKKMSEWMELTEVDDDDDVDGDTIVEQMKSNYENYPYVNDDDDVDMY